MGKYTFKRGTPFWDRVYIKVPNDCWLWLAGKGSHGYGQMPNQGLAHRIAYEDKRGPIPDGLVIDHLCQNRLCCNPAHMEPVTRAENSRRGEKNRKTYSGRSRPDLTERTECVNGHEFTGDNYYRRGNARICRICAAERHARFRARQKEQRENDIDSRSTRGGDD